MVKNHQPVAGLVFNSLYKSALAGLHILDQKCHAKTDLSY